MGIDDHPVLPATLVKPPPAPAWARRLAIAIGLHEADQCADQPGWMLWLREILTGEQRPGRLADPELETLRARAACMAADARLSKADLQQLLAGESQHCVAGRILVS